MMPTHHTSPPKKVGFILIPGFATTSFALAVEALSVANQLDDNQPYEYHLYSGDPDLASRQVTSSNGIPVRVDAHFSQCQRCDLLIICAYHDAPGYDNPALFSRLRLLKQSGASLAALTCGSFILARAGLLDAGSCTLFSDQIPSFRELFPGITIQDNIYTVSPNIFTCPGGMTTLDMMLFIIGKDKGADFANRVSHQFCQDRIRSPEEFQNSRRYLELRMKSPCLGAAIEVMEQHIEHPCSIERLADKIGTTTRTLEQVFKTHEETTPVTYYLNLRLRRARKMLEETKLPVSTIAQATGFTSQSYFTKRFREAYRVAPGQLRNVKK